MLKPIITETRQVDIVMTGFKAQVKFATGADPEVALIDTRASTHRQGANRMDLKADRLNELSNALIEVEAYIATAKVA
jgi:hypothetical protein